MTVTVDWPEEKHRPVMMTDSATRGWWTCSCSASGESKVSARFGWQAHVRQVMDDERDDD